MTRASDRTPVVFRSWSTSNACDPDAVDALFPTLPGNADGSECVAYAHIGQHGAADYFGVIARTRPARPAEYAPLLAELRAIGYRVQVCAREPRGAFNARRAAVRRILETAPPANAGGTA
jgi:hypothetical protein